MMVIYIVKQRDVAIKFAEYLRNLGLHYKFRFLQHNRVRLEVEDCELLAPILQAFIAGYCSAKKHACFGDSQIFERLESYATV